MILPCMNSWTKRHVTFQIMALLVSSLALLDANPRRCGELDLAGIGVSSDDSREASSGTISWTELSVTIRAYFPCQQAGWHDTRPSVRLLGSNVPSLTCGCGVYHGCCRVPLITRGSPLPGHALPKMARLPDWRNKVVRLGINRIAKMCWASATREPRLTATSAHPWANYLVPERGRVS